MCQFVSNSLYIFSYVDLYLRGKIYLMRKIIFLALLYIAIGSRLSAQDNIVLGLKREANRNINRVPDTTNNWRWRRGGLMSFNLAQGSLSNWAAGGDNFSLTVNGYFNYFIYYKKDRHNLDNNFDVNLGYVQSTSLGSRKNDDRFDYLSKYGYKMDSGGKWYLSGLFNFRSQFFDGFNFNNNIADFTSSFLSPAYVIVSAGFDYKPDNKLSIFLSPLTSRWVLVMNSSLSQKGVYGVPKGDNSINEIGAFATANYANTIAKNINYKGRLDLFTNYKNKPQNIDVFMTNIFSFKINKYFSATYTLDMIYDDDVKLFGSNKTSPALQTKSMIGIGFLKQIAPKRRI